MCGMRSPTNSKHSSVAPHFKRVDVAIVYAKYSTRPVHMHNWEQSNDILIEKYIRQNARFYFM